MYFDWDNLPAPRSSNAALQGYLCETLSSLESRFPNCGIMLVGEFNHFKTTSIQPQYGLKQIVKLPTRGSKTLHEILTNLSQYYTDIAKFAPFGLSDHCTVVAKAGDRRKKNQRLEL